MSTNNQSAMGKLIGEQNFALLTAQNILRLEAIITVDDFLTHVEELIIEGKIEDAIMFLKVLKDPKLFLMRGLISKTRNAFSTAMIEKKMKAEYEKKLLANGAEKTIKRVYDTIVKANQDLLLNDKIKMKKKNISIDIFNLSDLDSRNGAGYKVVAWQFIPSYIVEFKSSSHQGTWKFPECFIACDLDLVANKLTVNSEVYVIRPKNYMHPFVFSGRGGKMCLGTFRVSKANKVRISTTFHLIDLYLSTAEQVLVSGYTTERLSPANGHLYEEKYRKLKILDTVSEKYLNIQKGEKQKMEKLRKVKNGR